MFDKGRRRSKNPEEEKAELFEEIGRLKMEFEWLKKNPSRDLAEKRLQVERRNNKLSIMRQCELLGIHRSGVYYQPKMVDNQDLELKRLIDEQFTQTPFYGTRRLCIVLQEKGYVVNRKKVRRLTHEMGLEAIYPKPNLSMGDKQHKKYPYLLKDFLIDRPGQVWSEDITYIRLEKGFGYLTAVIDWFSRYVPFRGSCRIY